MMIKYRVHEVAKDLNVPNKEVLDVLQKYCEDTKKHMTALTEEELDLVFESFTQSHSLPSLDAYFADNQEEEEKAPASAPEKAKEPAAPAAKKDEKPAPKGESRSKETRPKENQGQEKAPDRDRRPRQNGQGAQNSKDGQNSQNNRTRRENTMNGQKDRKEQKPQRAQNSQPAQAVQPEKPVQATQPRQEDYSNTIGDSLRRQERIVDTRASHVELDKYNEKYDRLASEKVRVDNTVKKQKLTQRSSQYRGKPKNARRETEAERLRRIALERKTKPITVQIPDEITVGELALRLKAWASIPRRSLYPLPMRAKRSRWTLTAYT